VEIYYYSPNPAAWTGAYLGIPYNIYFQRFRLYLSSLVIFKKHRSKKPGGEGVRVIVAGRLGNWPGIPAGLVADSGDCLNGHVVVRNRRIVEYLPPKAKMGTVFDLILLIFLLTPLKTRLLELIG
jgi:hypothetical protein